MNQNPFVLGCGNTDADNLVDKLIGNAYQVVKYVALNMKSISIVSDNMAKVGPVGENIPAILAINTSMPTLVSLNENLPVLEALGLNLPALLVVYENVPAINTAVNNLPAIIAAPDAAALAQKWATQTAEEVIPGLGYGAKYYAELAAQTVNGKVNATDLANFADPLKGAGLSGFAPGLAYAANTLGAYVKTLVVKPGNSTGAPSTGTAAVNDRSVNLTVVRATPVVEWICTEAGTPGTWRALSWLVFSGTTAQRPALTANAVGVVYLDTTLAAGGKAITWTGTAWVDATGTTV